MNMLLVNRGSAAAPCGKPLAFRFVDVSNKVARLSLAAALP